MKIEDSSFKYDDPTELNIEQKELPYQTILTAIDQTYNNADEWDTYQERVKSYITPKEIDDYMIQLNYNGFLDIKLLRVSSIEFTNTEDIEKIHEGLQITPDSKSSSQAVYIVEGDKNSIILIPLKEDVNSLFVFTQHLHMAPDFIQKKWADTRKPKGLKDIRFLKPEELMKRKS